MNESLNCTLGRHSGHTNYRQQEVCAITGFGVLITFVFFIYIVSWDRSQLVGLNISLSLHF